MKDSRLPLKPHPDPATESDNEDSPEGFPGPLKTTATVNEFFDKIEPQ